MALDMDKQKQPQKNKLDFDKSAPADNKLSFDKNQPKATDKKPTYEKMTSEKTKADNLVSANKTTPVSTAKKHTSRGLVSVVAFVVIVAVVLFVWAPWRNDNQTDSSQGEVPMISPTIDNSAGEEAQVTDPTATETPLPDADDNMPAQEEATVYLSDYGVKSNATLAVPQDGMVIDNEADALILSDGGHVAVSGNDGGGKTTITLPKYASINVTTGEISVSGDIGIIVAPPNGTKLNVADGAHIFLSDDSPVGYRIEVPMSFDDVAETAWYIDDVRFVLALELLGDISDSSFYPDETVSYEQFYTILAKLSGIPTYTGELWFNSTKDLSDAITREAAITILWEYANCPIANNDIEFDDASDISSEAIDAIKWGTSVGIVFGFENNFTPHSVASRAQIAAVIHRYIEVL